MITFIFFEEVLEASLVRQVHRQQIPSVSILNIFIFLWNPCTGSGILGCAFSYSDLLSWLAWLLRNGQVKPLSLCHWGKKCFLLHFQCVFLHLGSCEVCTCSQVVSFCVSCLVVSEFPGFGVHLGEIPGHDGLCYFSFCFFPLIACRHPALFFSLFADHVRKLLLLSPQAQVFFPQACSTAL